MSEHAAIQQPTSVGENPIPAHLSHRLISDEFTVVDIGHRSTPIVLNEARRFDGESWYFGVEAWIYEGPDGSPYGLKHWQTIFADQNVEFINHELGITKAKFLDDNNSPSSQLEEYDATTILGDEIADEVFLSNVFTDPHIAGYPQRTKALLGEARRLMKPDGKLVIRETITPQVFKFGGALLATEGLKLDAEYTPTDNRALWPVLEYSYGYGDRTRNESFYQFISKSTQSL